MRALGAGITREETAGPDGTPAIRWVIDGVGVGGLAEPADVLDMGNSGTAARLLMGLLATHPLVAVMTGDASLRKRPMARVATPLEKMGAKIVTRAGGRLPATVIGTRSSAQVKSAILLAGLNTPGRTVVVEPEATRDHTERMLGAMGARITVETEADGARVITLDGQPELSARDMTVPGDPSSAAFPLVAGLITEGSAVTVRNVCLNPGRDGLIRTLAEMGADLTVTDPRDVGGEPVGDLVARSSALRAVTVPADRAPSMIDEFPVLAAAAATAHGTSRFEGLAELRVKESDRLQAVADGLARAGVTVRTGEDWLEVDGCGGPVPGGTDAVVTHLDHRIAMAFLVLGLAARNGMVVDDDRMIATSFPGFRALMTGLGCDITDL
jgi:3-phosphoshikimate 1-carboxyvinyltransferase